MTPSKPVLDMTQGTVVARPRQKFANAKAWTRQSLSPADWTVKIDDAVKKELDGVVRMTRRQALPVMLLDPIDFDLPASRAMMGRVKNILDDGHGFTVIDRLPMDDWSEDEARAMIETNAADFFGFDLDALRPLADEIGPTVDAVAEVLVPDDYPRGSTCNAFDKAQVLRSW